MNGLSVQAGMNDLDKANAAFIKLFNPEFDSFGIPAFETYRSGYIHFTGDVDVNGLFFPKRINPGLRACQGFDSGSLAYAQGNALSMWLTKEYKKFAYNEDIFISQKNPAKDFRPNRSVQLGYFGDLPDVDPETQNYSDVQRYDDSEAQYSIGQKGAVIWVTRMHIINDAIGLIKGMVSRMARAARKTHAKYVWSFYINNEVCPDGAAWFAAGHGNLGGNALDFSPLIAAITALAGMREPGPSQELLGLDFASFNWRLVAPISLWETAVKVNQAEFYYSANDLTTKINNPCRKMFGDRNERIVLCPFLTDTNDWGVIRDNEDVPIVEMSYLNGREEPEFILHEGPTDEQVLVGDRIGYKVRHEYGGALTDYRGGYKSIVA